MARRGRDDCPLPSPALPDNTLSGQWASRDTVRVIDVVRLPDGATRRGSSHRYLGRASCGRTEKRGDDLEGIADSVGGAARPWQPLLSTDTDSTCSPPTPPAGTAQTLRWPLAGKRPKSALSFFRRSDGENEKKRRCACPISRFANGGCRRLCQSSSSSRLEKHSGSLFFPLILSLPMRV